MASLEDTRKRQIAMLSHKTTHVRRIRHDVCISRLLKFSRPQRKAYSFTAEPIALVVAVAVHERDFDALVKEVAELVESIAQNEVACCVEAEGDG
jgi:hypothetical protein